MKGIHPSKILSGCLDVFILLVLAGILLAWGWDRFASLTLSRKPETQPPSVASVLRNADLRTLQAVERFESGLSRDPSPRLEARASKTADSLSRIPAMLHLVRLMAVDKFKGSAEAPQYLQKAIETQLAPEIDHLKNGSRILLNDLAAELSTTRVEVVEGLQSVLRQDPLTEKRVLLSLQRLGRSSLLLGATFSLDAVLLSQSTVFPRVASGLLKMSASLLGKSITRAGTSAVIPLVDGPLPFGDIVAGAGLAWTVYDLNRIQDRFREEIRVLTHQALLDCHQEIRSRTLALAKKLILTHQQQGDRMKSLVSVPEPAEGEGTP